MENKDKQNQRRSALGGQESSRGFPKNQMLWTRVAKLLFPFENKMSLLNKTKRVDLHSEKKSTVMRHFKIFIPKASPLPSLEE